MPWAWGLRQGPCPPHRGVVCHWVPLTEGVNHASNYQAALPTEWDVDRFHQATKGSTAMGGGLYRPACHCHPPAWTSGEGKRRKGSPPSSPHALKTKKGVKANIKLPRTPLLPTHPVRFPHQRSHGTAGVTVKLIPQTETSPHPQGPSTLERPARRPSPAEVLRSNLFLPSMTRTKCRWGPTQRHSPHLPIAAPPMAAHPPLPPQPYTSDTQEYKKESPPA